MASIDKRRDQKGNLVYRVRVRRKGYEEQVATFRKLSEARRWAQKTEAAVLEGKYFSAKSNRYTLNDLIDRYSAHSALRADS